MIYSFTDFGSQDIYVGQLRTVMAHHAPDVPYIDLLHDAPTFDVLSSAHLLHAIVSQLPMTTGDVCLAVVDPGVGGVRRPVAMLADGVWFVGPDNGLLSVLAQRSRQCSFWEIAWRPEQLAASFHGRDLFAPVAARLAAGTLDGEALKAIAGLDVVLDGGDLPRVIYIDHYGNAITGIRWPAGGLNVSVVVQGKILGHSRVFCEVLPGAAFCYENSLGLLEIAVNGGNAAEKLHIKVGEPIKLVSA